MDKVRKALGIASTIWITFFLISLMALDSAEITATLRNLLKLISAIIGIWLTFVINKDLNERGKKSKLWLLAPFFLSIIGAAGYYYLDKKKNKP